MYHTVIYSRVEYVIIYDTGTIPCLVLGITQKFTSLTDAVASAPRSARAVQRTITVLLGLVEQNCTDKPPIYLIT